MKVIIVLLISLSCIYLWRMILRHPSHGSLRGYSL